MKSSLLAIVFAVLVTFTGAAQAQDIFATVPPNSNGSDAYVDIQNTTGGILYFFTDPSPSAARMAKVVGGSEFLWPSIGNFAPDPQNFQQNRIFNGSYLRVYPKTLPAGSEIQVEFSYTQLGPRYHYRVSVLAGARVDSIFNLDPLQSTASTVRWMVTFDQPISNVTAANFALESGIPGVSIVSVTPDTAQPSANWTVTATTGMTVGSIGLRWVGHQTETPSVPNQFVTQFPYQFSDQIFIVQNLPTDPIVVLPNTTTTFAVVATRRSGQELFYRWYVTPPGSTTPVAIPGATNATFTPPITSSSYTPPAYASGTYQYFFSVFGSPGQEFTNFLHSNMATVSVLTLNAAAQAGFINTTGTAPYDLANATGVSPAGGTFSGNGVSNGVFNPASAGLGVHTITYSLGGVQVTFTITVNEQPSLNVTTTTDVANKQDGLTSLREALAYAQSLGGAQTVTFGPALAGQTVMLSDGWNDANDDTALRISGDLTIDGGNPVNPVTLAIPQGTQRRHLLAGNGLLQLKNLRFVGGNLPSNGIGGVAYLYGNAQLTKVVCESNSAGEGGGLFVTNTAIVQVTDSLFQNNIAANGSGGAIVNAGGTLTVNDSKFTGNTSPLGGALSSDGSLTVRRTTFNGNGNTSNSEGGALRLFGTVDIAESTISNNSATNGGGLISYGNTTLTNVTIANNTATNGGGAWLHQGTGLLRCVTVARNTATSEGGGTIVSSANVTAVNTIVSGNAAPTNANLSGAAFDAASSNNLLNLTLDAALLGSLGENVGPTQTIALLPGSPAINAGVAVSGITTDQRGAPRGSQPDIGAFEAIPVPVVSINPQDQAVPEGETATFNALANYLYDGTAPSTMSNGAALLPGQYLLSANHAYQLLYQGDGNLVLYRGDGAALWGSGTAGQTPGQVVMQGDGNLVIYGSGGSQYATGTSGNPNAVLTLQNDGNLVIYTTVPIFATNTASYAPFNPVPTVQWQVSTDHGATFTDIAGATGVTLSFTAALGDNDNLYRAIFSNGSGVVVPTASATLTILTLQAPSITSASGATFAVGASGTFQVSANGYPAPTFSVTGTLPNGVTFNEGVLSGTPSAGSGGAYSLTITASNGVGSDATQSFTLSVNEAPAITSGNAATFAVGNAGNFAMTASGFPAPNFSTTSTLPNGVSLSAAGVLSGSSSNGGSYSLAIKASNGIGSDATQTFTLTVNQAPAITSGDAATFVVGTAGDFAMTASGFPAPSFSTASALPNGISLSAGGVLSGTPMPGTGGVYDLSISASNGNGAPATQTLTLTINQAPSITSANSVTFTVGNVGWFTVETSGFPAPTSGVQGTLPTGVNFNAAVLAGAPAQGTAGNYPLTFTASNGVGSGAAQNFTLAINDAVCTEAPAGLTTWLTGENSAADAQGGLMGTARDGAGYAAGKVGQGFTFNGTTAVVELPDNAAWDFGVSGFTVQAWVKFSAVSGSDVLVAHSDGGGNVNKWIFWLKNGSLEFHLDGSAAADITSSAAFAPVLGQWHHLAVTRSGNTWRFYVDGVQNGADRFDSNTVPDASAPLSLGKADGLNALNGMLDEAQIFNRALDASEIAAIYGASIKGLCFDALQSVSAVSRKTHGNAGDFDVPLPLTGAPGVECRSGEHKIVIAFNNTIIAGAASVTAGSVNGAPTFSGNTMTIDLSNVPNANSVIVSLSNVQDAFGQTVATLEVPMEVLLGDINGSRTVNASDISQIKALSGQPLTPANFRADITLNGMINGSDLSLIKAAAGTFLP